MDATIVWTCHKVVRTSKLSKKELCQANEKEVGKKKGKEENIRDRMGVALKMVDKKEWMKMII